MRMCTMLALALALAACGGGKDDGGKGKSARGGDDDDPYDRSDRGYMRRDKRESMLQLGKIAKRAKEALNERSRFPVATIPLTPAKSCCEQNHGDKRRCAPNPADWSGDWRKLELALEEPHLFQYSYESTDGKTFVAKAVGDLDCDGTAVTYEARGVIVDGIPRVEFTEPPPNSD
jgi:hypothetical protein